MRSCSTWPHVSAVLVLLCAPLASAQEPVVVELPAGFERLGQITPRHARAIAASNWSVGAETMDRGYTTYSKWREHLGPLGVKSARIQSGWARTEKSPGVYDWSWLDEIIPDMVDQGVKPWVSLSFGNPIYEGGGTSMVSSRLPTGPALERWDAFVRAIVERYGKQVDEWEIWNEPLIQKIPLEEYAAFVMRTAAVVREAQPSARILIGAFAGSQTRRLPEILQLIQDAGKLSLVDVVTYHPYKPNPDSVWGDVNQLRADIARYSDRITIFQGENGCPSTSVTYGALSGHDWTELSQAKWTLRRLLGDLGHDIRSSYFSIIDLHYASEGGGVRLNTKGLLASREDQSVDHRKPAYRAYQHITAIFDESIARAPDAVIALGDQADTGALAAFAYEKRGVGPIVTLWRSGAMPSNALESQGLDVTITGVRFEEPVYVDMLSGAVHRIPAEQIEVLEEFTRFRSIPVGDWPVLIAEAAALPWRAAGAPEPATER